MRYHQEIEHKGLNKRRVITGSDPGIVGLKARQQIETWEGEWERRQAHEGDREAKLIAAAQEREARQATVARQREAKQARKDLATQRTQDAQAALAELNDLLAEALARRSILSWNGLKDTSPFPQPKPQKSVGALPSPQFPEPRPAKPTVPNVSPKLLAPHKPHPEKPVVKLAPRFPEPRPTKPTVPDASPKPAAAPEPRRWFPPYQPPKLGILDNLSARRRERKIAQAEAQHQLQLQHAEQAHNQQMEQWNVDRAQAQAAWEAQEAARRRHISENEDQYAREVKEWKKREDEYLIEWEGRVQEKQAEYEREVAEWEKREEDYVRECEMDWERKVQETQAKYARKLETWERTKKNYLEKRERKMREEEAEYAQKVALWERRHDKYIEKQRKANARIDAQRDAYLHRDPDAVRSYCELVLARSDYPDCISKDFDLAFNPETATLIVEYSLPLPENLPSVKEVKYLQSRDEFTETRLSERDAQQLYDSTLYQIALRTLHELYKANAAKAISSIVFNGWVTSIDKATGKPASACIMSLMTTRKEFGEINLADIDPKECFRKLKGVASPQLYSITPIAPVLTMSREDARFVSSYDVASDIGEGYNLAAMPWEDFEHLIRELFEWEFSEGGGEVKITRTSRDRGVDAIAFDPDPIRGGKIVIQAKRYTNTVGVDAVRDLYGTVINEGAIKGLLVTTSDYGPDAHEFAKGKPLTLLNGSNLLHLLAKHGHKAKIDLREAKLLESEMQKAQRRSQ